MMGYERSLQHGQTCERDGPHVYGTWTGRFWISENIQECCRGIWGYFLIDPMQNLTSIEHHLVPEKLSDHQPTERFSLRCGCEYGFGTPVARTLTEWQEIWKENKKEKK